MHLWLFSIGIMYLRNVQYDFQRRFVNFLLIILFFVFIEYSEVRHFSLTNEAKNSQEFILKASFELIVHLELYESIVVIQQLNLHHESLRLFETSSPPLFDAQFFFLLQSFLLTQSVQNLLGHPVVSSFRRKKIKNYHMNSCLKIGMKLT